MLSSGSGTYYDGIAAARRAVTVELDKTMLVVRGADGDILQRWPYDHIEELPAPAGVLRLGRFLNPISARLDIRDEALGALVKGLVAAIDKRSSAADRRGRVKVVAWSIAAVISLVTLGVVGVPAIADRLAPLIPVAAEHELGRAVEAQVRTMLDQPKSGKPFECGGENEKAGRAAVDKLVGRLESAAALPIALHVVVARRKEANAFALPGGTIYLFEGLIDKVENADELAGVIAHEIGHVAHRDGTRSVLQSAGLSFLFGMVLGDFVGGGAVIVAAQSVLSSAYSREVESSADQFAVELMNRIGRDGRAFAAILQRIAGSIEPGMTLIADHPQTSDRVKSIGRNALAPSAAALVSAPEWAALKQVCAGR